MLTDSPSHRSPKPGRAGLLAAIAPLILVTACADPTGTLGSSAAEVCTIAGSAALSVDGSCFSFERADPTGFVEVAPGSPAFTREPDTGSLYADASPQSITRRGTWTFSPIKTGVYRLAASAPPGAARTRLARYRVLAEYGETVVIADQAAPDLFGDNNVLGLFAFRAGEVYTVTLDNHTGELGTRVIYQNLSLEVVKERAEHVCTAINLTADTDSRYASCVSTPRTATQHGEGCAWYACASSCQPMGTPLEDVCSTSPTPPTPPTPPTGSLCPITVGAVHATTLDDSGPCFEMFGTPQFWRTDDIGHEGQSHFTYRVQSPLEADNAARWHLDIGQEGFYDVWVSVPRYLLFDDPLGAPPSQQVSYRVLANGTPHSPPPISHTVPGTTLEDTLVHLGRFFFSAGKGQWIEVTDVTGEPGVTRIHADSIVVVPAL